MLKLIGYRASDPKPAEEANEVSPDRSSRERKSEVGRMDDNDLRGHEKLLKRRSRLDVRKSVFSNRVINNWNSHYIICNTVNTSKTRISVVLNPERNVKSSL